MAFFFFFFFWWWWWRHIHNIKLTVLLDFNLQNEALGTEGEGSVRKEAVTAGKSQETLMFLAQ